MSDHLDIVQDEHRQQPPVSGNLQSCFDFELRVLTALALRFPAEKWGLLKSGGENILDYHGVLVKVGRLCQADGALVKILTDIPTTNQPAWNVEDPIDPARYVAFTGGAQPPVEPPVPPVVDPPADHSAEILQALALHAQMLVSIREKLDAHAARTEELATHFDDVGRLLNAKLERVSDVSLSFGIRGTATPRNRT